MSVLVKLLTGAAGLAAVAGFASPAAAQYYPGYGYGYNNGGGVVGAIINSVIGAGQYGGYGYNGYGANTQLAVQRCAGAVQQRLGGGYGSYGGYGYNNGYGGGGRVVSITHADLHAGGITKVKGLATSGASYGGGYGGGYGYNNGGADLRFTCRVDYRGRIVDLDISRNVYGYDNGYYRGY